MRWEVSGWRGTEEGRWSVDAQSDAEARQKAAAAGITVVEAEAVADEAELARVTAVAVAPQEPTFACANCGRMIGRLEMPWSWEGHTICQECAARLAPAEQTLAAAAAMQPQINVNVSPTYYSSSGYGAGRRVVAIERTGKAWKAQMVFSAMFLILGVLLMVGAASIPSAGVAWGGAVLLGMGLTAFGLVWFVFARVGAWWNHG